MLSNLQTQETLVSTDVNKTNLHDLFLYLQRIMVSFFELFYFLVN